MIADANAAKTLTLAWEAVRDDRNVIVGNLNMATMAGRPASGVFRDLCFNLLLARGFSVIEDSLEEFRSQGTFVSKSRQLGRMMEMSRTAVPWCDYDQIDHARERRNATVHDRVRLPHSECRDYLAAIERELVRWHIVAAVKPELWHW